MTSSGSTGALLAVRQFARRLEIGTASERELGPFELQVTATERLGLSGPSGVGKTLFLRGLAGLDAWRGELTFDGQPLQPTHMPLYRTRVMYLPQQTRLPEGTVREALQEPYRFKVYRHKAWSEAQIQSWLEPLALSARFLEQDNQRLSGGERQLVALMRALQLEPQILLLDEPSSALDPARTAALESLLLHWQQEQPRAWIWVSHDAAQLQRCCQRCLDLWSEKR